MNFGQNIHNLFMENAQPIVLLALAAIGLILIFKRETSKLLGFIIVAIVAVALVFNATGFSEVLLKLGNRIIGS